jgi:hypothetical protein
MRLKEPKASTEIVYGGNCGPPYGKFPWPRQGSTICRMQNAVSCVRMRVIRPFRSGELSNKSLPNGM